MHREHGDSFAKNLRSLISGTAGAQALTILAAPVLARLYSPSDFGLLAAYIGILTLFGVIASFRYDYSILLPEQEDDAAHLVILSAGITTIFSSIVFLLSFFFSKELMQLSALSALSSYFWLVPIGIFFLGIYQIANYWSMRQKNFSVIARSKIQQSIGQLVIQVAGYQYGGLSLIAGSIVGQSSGSIRMISTFLKSVIIKDVSLSKIKRTFFEYRYTAFHSSCFALLNSASVQLTPILLVMLFDPGSAGYYALAQRVLNTPMSIVGAAVGNVFFAHAAEAKRNGQLTALVSTVTTALVRLATPPTLILIFAGPHIFGLIFGENWIIAGIYSQLLSSWLFMVFITSPLTTLPSIIGRDKYGTLFQLALLTTRLAAIYVGYSFDDALLAITLFSASSTICWLLFLWWVLRAIDSSLMDLTKPLLQSLGNSFLICTPLAIAHFSNGGSSFWMVSIGITGCLTALYSYRVYRKQRTQLPLANGQHVAPN
ncbi:oligosaccharide flippase family protein [Pigmentiphaga sp. D-2]|uniref:oligosaccharide flippase family protein n=1 Tax=Pigmentiphaga sp. D-2 TaxID=1002116 RepID=UPI0010490F6A|nr:oligosaccharide flippase family protein [Pigmentiphaga sp. D-2]